MKTALSVLFLIFSIATANSAAEAGDQAYCGVVESFCFGNGGSGECDFDLAKSKLQASITSEDAKIQGDIELNVGKTVQIVGATGDDPYTFYVTAIVPITSCPQ